MIVNTLLSIACLLAVGILFGFIRNRLTEFQRRLDRIERTLRRASAIPRQEVHPGKREEDRRQAQLARLTSRLDELEHELRRMNEAGRPLLSSATTVSNQRADMGCTQSAPPLEAHDPLELPSFQPLHLMGDDPGAGTSEESDGNVPDGSLPLTLLPGVDDTLRSHLKILGFTTMGQIAACTTADVALISQYLNVPPERIRREWIPAARRLIGRFPVSA